MRFSFSMQIHRKSLSDNTRVRAFTLIEVVVVISTLAFILPIVTIMLFIILRQQLTVARMTEVKRQGDQAISFMQSKINAQAEHMYNNSGVRVCAARQPDPIPVSYFKDARDSTTIKFELNDEGILMYKDDIADPPVNTPMTNAKVFVEGLTMQCVRNDTFTHPIVGIDFSMVAGGNISAAEKEATRLHFSTKSIIRNR